METWNYTLIYSNNEFRDIVHYLKMAQEIILSNEQVLQAKLIDGYAEDMLKVMIAHKKKELYAILDHPTPAINLAALYTLVKKVYSEYHLFPHHKKTTGRFMGDEYACILNKIKRAARMIRDTISKIPLPDDMLTEVYSHLPITQEALTEVMEQPWISYKYYQPKPVLEVLALLDDENLPLIPLTGHADTIAMVRAARPPSIQVPSVTMTTTMRAKRNVEQLYASESAAGAII